MIECLSHFSSCNIPNSDSIFITTTRKQLTIWAKANRENRSGMFSESFGDFFGRDFPSNNGLFRYFLQSDIDKSLKVVVNATPLLALTKCCWKHPNQFPVVAMQTVKFQVWDHDFPNLVTPKLFLYWDSTIFGESHLRAGVILDNPMLSIFVPRRDTSWTDDQSF